MKNALQTGEFVEALDVPCPAHWRISAYKIAKRYDSDISTVCAVLALQMKGSGAAGAFAFGGMAATVKRRRCRGQPMQGQAWRQMAQPLRSAGARLQALSDLRASEYYRLRVAQNLFTSAGWRRRPAAQSLEAAHMMMVCTGVPRSRRPCTSPAARPTPTTLSSRAAGICMPRWASRRWRTGGRSASTFERLRAQPGVVAVLTADDVPAENSGPLAHDDPILAHGELRYLGQPVFAVIATTRDAARRAAAGAAVIRKPRGPCRRFERRWRRTAAGRYVVPPCTWRAVTPPAPARFACAFRVNGIWRAGAVLPGRQISFAMPQEGRHRAAAALLRPTPSEMQQLGSPCAGLGSHRINVQCRRMGGGFGGKESQSAAFACVASIAALRLGHPVKLRVDRDDDSSSPAGATFPLPLGCGL